MRERDGTVIGPDQFIPAAEKYNLMQAIDRWVIHTALNTLASVHFPTGIPLCAINLSGASVADETMATYLHEMFDRYDVDPHRICLEITETTAIANLSRAQIFIESLRQRGVAFALDDFGNGFSSFAYLKNLRVQYLKIDGSFVRDITANPIDLALVEAVNTIGHVMNMETIAEYVKDGPTQTLLERMGVDYIQGYNIAKPRPLSPYLYNLTLEQRAIG